MKKPQRYLYVVSPGGLGCTAFFGAYEIDHLKEPEVAAAEFDQPVAVAREGKQNWAASAVRLSMTVGRAIRQRLQRRPSSAAA